MRIYKQLCNRTENVTKLSEPQCMTDGLSTFVTEATMLILTSTKT